MPVRIANSHPPTCQNSFTEDSPLILFANHCHYFKQFIDENLAPFDISMSLWRQIWWCYFSLQDVQGRCEASGVGGSLKTRHYENVYLKRTSQRILPCLSLTPFLSLFQIHFSNSLFNPAVTSALLSIFCVHFFSEELKITFNIFHFNHSDYRNDWFILCYRVEPVLLWVQILFIYLFIFYF